jgi:hypothetical protein
MSNTKYNEMDDELKIEVSEHSYDKGDLTYTHPSFGHVSASRFTGGDGKFFGSDVKSHQSGVSLRIQTSELKRGLSNDWFHPHNQLIEVKMSEIQWASLITNMNASGTPCTIVSEHTRGRVTLADIPDKFETYKKEFSSHLDNSTKLINELTESLALMSAGKTIKKGDLKAVIGKVSYLQAELGSNLTFVENQLHEEVDHIKMDAIKSIEGTILNKVHEMGIKAINADSIPNMIEGNRNDE